MVSKLSRKWNSYEKLHFFARIYSHAEFKVSATGFSASLLIFPYFNVLVKPISKAYSEPCHTSKMECFSKIINGC